MKGVVTTELSAAFHSRKLNSKPRCHRNSTIQNTTQCRIKQTECRACCQHTRKTIERLFDFITTLNTSCFIVLIPTKPPDPKAYLHNDGVKYQVQYKSRCGRASSTFPSFEYHLRSGLQLTYMYFAYICLPPSFNIYHLFQFLLIVPYSY